MQHVYDVDTPDFGTAVIERSQQVPVIVDFWAEWCGPCKVLGPMLERAVENAAGAVELAKVDVDRNQQLAGQFGVQGIPTVVAFKKGGVVNRFTGALPEPQIVEFVNSLAPTAIELTITKAEELLDVGDDGGAEELLGAVLAEDPHNQDAGVLLAGIHLDRDDPEAALALLDGLAPSDEVQQLQAAARISVAESIDVGAAEALLTEDPNNLAASLDVARAEAARGEVEPALERLLSIVEAKAAESDAARKAMLDIFELRGNDDPLVRGFRQRLASALF